MPFSNFYRTYALLDLSVYSALYMCYIIQQIPFLTLFPCLFLTSLDGKALLTYKQENPSEHVDLNEVLKALGIEDTITTTTAAPEPKMECTEDACALPAKS